MTARSRCGVGAWHPEARTRLAVDCELRVPQALPAAVVPKAISRPLAGGFAPKATGSFVGHRDHERTIA